jgi:hypothetical protein
MITCPYCEETNVDEAVKCLYCAEKFDDVSSSSPPDTTASDKTMVQATPQQKLLMALAVLTYKLEAGYLSNDIYIIAKRKIQEA